MSNFTRMAMAYPFPLPDPPRKPVHQPNYYLSEEASALRIAALVERLAKNADSPDYWRVPASIRRRVDEIKRRTPAFETEREQKEQAA